MPIEYTRQQTPAEERAAALKKLTAAAKRGESPRLFPEEDLRWLFGADMEAEVEELAQVAEQARAARLEKHRKQKAAEELRSATNAVLEEWAVAELAERRKLAEKEARRRLGLEAS
jgi:hypothetical protein